jgi:hypothetical protein
MEQFTVWYQVIFVSLHNLVPYGAPFVHLLFITKSLIILMICKTIQKNWIVYQIIYFGRMIIFYIIHLKKRII